MLRNLRIENLVLIRDAELALAPGLNAITGETGAGKTILAQAIGLLLGTRGDASLVGAGAGDAYVEAELDLPAGLLDEESFEALAELRPEDEDGLVLARRIFADGRTRAYAWGRSAAREDVAAAAERVIAMSGQFEQRRLNRPSYRLDLLDAFVGEGQLARRIELRRAWRELQGARRRYEEVATGAAAGEARLAELRALVEATAELEPGQEDALRGERERLRHATELLETVDSALRALDPEDGDGAAGLTASAERDLGSVERLAAELAKAGYELRDIELRLREVTSSLRAFATSLEADPGRLEEIESGLERIADAKRRFRCQTLAELLGRAAEARDELQAIDDGTDPEVVAREALEAARARVDALADELRCARRDAAAGFATAVATELRAIGMGEGEFRVELDGRETGPSGSDEVAFMIRPNPGLPFAPAAETASGGELSRIALAIAAVGGGETMVFDEIDAGIGGEAAHAVAATLARLAERAQVVTITHLPQIASRADRHFRVEKVPGDPTHARIETLAEDERRAELERMLGGREFLSAFQE
jgi:DNA repair protein RecN (Recombination protein N)